MTFERETFYSTEIYAIAKGIGLPITRSLMNMYRKRGKYQPVAKHFQMYVYSRADVISILTFIAKFRKIGISREDIIGYLRLNYDIPRA